MLVAKRPFVEILRRHLAWTSVEILSKVLLHRDVLQRSCLETSDRETLYTEILPRCLLQHPDTEISHRGSCQEIPCSIFGGGLPERSSLETLCGDLSERSLMKVMYGDLLNKFYTEVSRRELAKRDCTEVAFRDLA